MYTVIFSIYDCGCRSSAMLLSDGASSPNDYFEDLENSVDITLFEDDKLFAYFSELFKNKSIREIIIIEDGLISKVRYKAECFVGKYFGVVNRKLPGKKII